MSVPVVDSVMLTAALTSVKFVTMKMFKSVSYQGCLTSNLMCSKSMPSYQWNLYLWPVTIGTVQPFEGQAISLIS